MQNVDEQDQKKETQRLGKGEESGFCLVTLKEFSLLNSMKGATGNAITAELKLNQDSRHPIAEVLTMLLQERTEESTQYQILLSAAAIAMLRNQTNNAHLIAAAPEMLAEMEKLAQALEDTGHEPPQSFYDVIKKARGE